MTRLLRRLRYLWQRDLHARELDDELRFHLEMKQQELESRGLDRAAAATAARRALGNLPLTRDHVRDVWFAPWLQSVVQDVRYGLRTLSRHPGFATIALATLALGIGATTAIFSVVNAVLLTPLPYRNSDQLVYIVQHADDPMMSDDPAPRALAALDAAQLPLFRSQIQLLSHVAALGITSATLTGQGDAVRLDGAQVSLDTFAMLGVQPLLGRPFAGRDEPGGADPVLILGHGLWQRRFGADPDIIGRIVTLEGVDRAVVGVMPPRFAFPDAQTQFWIPLVLSPAEPGRRRRVPVLARLKDGVTREAATAEVNVLLSGLGAGGVPPPPNPGAGPSPGRGMPARAPIARPNDVAPASPRFELVGVEDRLTAPLQPALVVLAAAAGLVLLIACANVANLLLAHATVREREVVTRLFLGAGRGRLLRQSLTENLTLAVLGGGVGIGLAHVGVRLLPVLAATSSSGRELDAAVVLPRLDEVGIDASVLAFALAVSLLSGFLSGAIPALRGMRPGSADLLRQGGGSAVSGFDVRRGNRTQGLLVAFEIGLALVLSIGSGLLMRSFVELASVDPGYDAEGIVAFQVDLPGGRNLVDLSENVASRVQSLPGVLGAAYTRQLPMARARSLVPLRTTPELPGEPAPPPAPPGTVNPPEWPDTRHVSHDYLDVMGIDVLAGRGFSEGDGAGRQALLINETLERSGLLGPNPIGRQVYALGILPWEVVGVIEDVHQSGLDHEPGPQVFMDIRQLPDSAALAGAMYFVVRTGEDDPAALIPAIRRIVRDLDARATVGHVATLDRLLANSTARPRLYAVLLALFSALAVSLAAAGIYGVVAYAAARRTREIGIRIALGARRDEVTRLMLGQSAAFIVLGVALGLAGSAVAMPYLRGLLFGLAPLDARTFVSVSIALAGIAALAAYPPARRAARVDPLSAIRYE